MLLYVYYPQNDHHDLPGQLLLSNMHVPAGHILSGKTLMGKQNKRNTQASRTVLSTLLKNVILDIIGQYMTSVFMQT